jgi:hypothetical protein
LRKRELRRELEHLARDEADSGRAKLAKIEALRLIERLDREGEEDYPVDDDGRFHPGPPSMWDLDRHDPDEVRERWRLNWLADTRGRKDAARAP